jgi:uncharacterized RDD family membrane protein YckC
VGAAVVDFLVLLGALGATYVGWSAFLLLLRGDRFRFPTPSFTVAYAVGACVLTVYLAAAWTITGRTYGGHLLGLRVVNATGHRMRPLGALLRAVICVVFPIGLFWCAVSGTNRAVHDLVMRTSVVYDWEERPAGR